jgi:hypothetical protein
MIVQENDQETKKNFEINKVNMKLSKILIITASILCLTAACEKIDRDKRNYTICSRRIIELSKTMDAAPDSYPEKLEQKVLELCNIYGFLTIDEFIAAKDKYGDEINTPAQKEKLEEILRQISLDSLKIESEAVSFKTPQQKPGEYLKTKTLPGDSSTIKERAISLKILQQKLKENHGKRSLPTELSQLCGITRIIGYVKDEVNRDILLLGSVDESLLPLYLDDFVIALRNAWLKYAELRGNTRYYSYPGCTIDPDPNVLKRLDEIGVQIQGNREVKEVEESIDQWKRVCKSPQKVWVFGVPFDTHFGWVMVKADYDMKCLVDGSDPLDIPGFSSLIDMELEIAKESILSGKPISIPLSSMNRFWFYPGKYHYLEDEDMVIIDECPVILLTEEEFLTKGGKVAGSGRANPYAKKFTEIFSALYPRIAGQRPIYCELENLFRFVALAKILKFKSPHEKIRLDIDYLLNQYPVSSTTVDKFLPGRSNVKGFKHRKEYEGGYSNYQLWIPSCGGVSIEIEANRENFSQSQTSRLHGLKNPVLKNRPSPSALTWDYGSSPKLKAAEDLIDPKEIQELTELNQKNAGSSAIFIVEKYESKYRLFYDSTRPIYEGDNKYQLLKKTIEKLPKEQREKTVIIIDLKNSSEKDAKAFEELLQTIKIPLSPGTAIVVIPRKNNSTELRDTLLSPDVKTEVVSPKEPAVEEVTKGKYRGWYVAALEFFVRQGNVIKKLTLRVFSTVQEALERFSRLIWQKRSSPVKHDSLLRDVIEVIKDTKKAYEGKGKIGIIIEFLEQILGIDIGFLDPLLLEEHQRIKAAA